MVDIDIDPEELEELGISKRQFMKGMAAAGATGMAGCTGGDAGEGQSPTEGQAGGQTDTPSGSNGADSSDQDQPKQGGKFVASSQGEPRNLSYWQSYSYFENNITTHIWDALFTHEGEAPYDLKPALATDMSIDDPTHFVFNLREGVKFHNGNEMTAEDVKASIEWVQNPKSKASLGWFFTNLKTMNVVDDYTLEWVLSKPDAIMKFVPATLGCAVAPKSQIEEKGLELGQKPVGAGPWKLDEWQSGNFIRLVPHEDYWNDGHPYLNELTFQIEPSSSSRVTGLRNRTFDTIHAFSTAQAPAIEKMSDVKLYKIKEYGAAFFTLNQTFEPFSNTNVRRAVSYAINVDELTKATKGKYGERAYSMIPEEMEFGYVGPEDLKYDGFPHNPEKARKMLDEEGFTGDPRFETTIHVPQSPDPQKAAKIVQSDLSEVGIKANIKSLTESGWFQEWFGEPPENQAPMLFGHWVTDFPDPQPLLEPLYRSGTTNNWTGYSNEKVDKLLDTVRNSLDTEERAKAAKKANRIVVDDANYVWLYHQLSTRAINKRYKGFVQRPPFFQFWCTIFGGVYDSQA